MTRSPALGEVVSWYGKRRPPLKPDGTYGTAFHAGVDIAPRGPASDAVVAPQSGVVARVARTSLRGLYVDVRLDEAGGRYTARGQHLASAAVEVGQRVGEHEQVGVMGTTGGVARHLHLEILDRGVAIDPTPWYRTRGVVLGQPTVVVLPTHTTAPVLEEDEMIDARAMLEIAYRQECGRSASEPELYPRLRRILEAKDPRAQLAAEVAQIDASTESNRWEVRKLYRELLGRDGSVAEWDSWIASVGGRDGVDLNAPELARIRAAIAAHPEAKAYAARTRA